MCSARRRRYVSLSIVPRSRGGRSASAPSLLSALATKRAAGTVGILRAAYSPPADSTAPTSIHGRKRDTSFFIGVRNLPAMLFPTAIAGQAHWAGLHLTAVP